MLDSVNTVKMLPTVAATVSLATAKPITDSDATKISNASTTVKTIQKTHVTTTPTHAITPTKAKTIFNWFRGHGSKSVDSGEPLYANQAKRASVKANGEANSDVAWPKVPTQRAKSLPPASQEAPQPAPATADATLREFRGVQSLRHLWNKRISASEDATRRNKSLLTNRADKLNKSIGCLVHAANTSAEVTHSAAPSAEQQLQRKRAQSLHDCTQVGVGETYAAAEAIAATCTATANNTIETELDCVHREKDNFYKYKTAEQAAKHLAREARVRAKTRRLTAGIVSSEATEENAHFPPTHASEKGERIHWRKRQDIVLRRGKQREEQRQLELEQHQQHQQHEEMAIVSAGGNAAQAAPASATSFVTPPTSPLSAHELVISVHETLNTNKQRQQLPTATTTTSTKMLATATASMVGCDTDKTLTANNSPRHSVSRKRTAQREATNASNSSSKRGSTDSSNGNAQTINADRATSATSGGRATRRTHSSSSSSTQSASGAAAARKYSFKTHSRSYHVPRKMSNRDSSGSAVSIVGVGSGSGGAAGVSMVAKLTQQFNELIQKDKKLLEEVKRKNGVLMSRGGHIYKVVEKTNVTEAGGSRKSTAGSPSISRNSSRAKDAPLRASMVQRNIRRFESGDTQPYADALEEQQQKPAVPAKSAQVLRKLREHNKAQQLSAGAAPAVAHRRLHTPTQLELKKAQLTLPLAPPLEVVAEESKTPLEAYENAIAAVSVSTVRANVPNDQIAESTYAPPPASAFALVDDAHNYANEVSNAAFNEAEIDVAKSAVMAMLATPTWNDTWTDTAEADAAQTSSEKHDQFVGSVVNKNRHAANVNEVMLAQRTKSAAPAVLQEQISAVACNDNNNSCDISNNYNGNESCTSNVSTDVSYIDATIETEASNAELHFPTTTTTTATPNATANSEAEAVRLALLAAADATAVPTSIAATTNEDDLDDVGEEKAKQRKHKYAKIYEKFRFRSPFGGGQSKKQSPSKAATVATEAAKTTTADIPTDATTLTTIAAKTTAVATPTACEEITTTTTTTPTAIPTPLTLTSDLTAATAATPSTEPAAAKILDALQMVDQKLKGLAVESDTAPIMLCAHDDFEQRVLPNSSFVYQASAKQVANNQLIVTQAVNVTLVNNIEGEQMVMEQKELHYQQQSALRASAVNQIVLEQMLTTQQQACELKDAPAEEEPMYEPIAQQIEETKTEYHQEYKHNQNMPAAPQSFIFKSCAASKVYAELANPAETMPEITTPVKSATLPRTLALPIAIPATAPTSAIPTLAPTTPLTAPSSPEALFPTSLLEDIYQTVEETQLTALLATPPIAAVSSSNQLADYESIAGSCEHTTPASTSTAPKPLYDGYEICEPPPDALTLPSTPLPLPAPPALPTATVTAAFNASQQSTLTNVRNTNDELPELPKPKRRLPKSPMPGKRAAAKTTVATRAPPTGAECAPVAHTTCAMLDDNDDDHHYYADDENIYDTIKGSHCYESLHAESLKSQQMNGVAVAVVGRNKNTAADNISLSSNCYESISHYRRGLHSNGGGHMASSRSNSGSTLTISSDQKTNSLYEMSMTASLLYSMDGLNSYQRQLDMQLSKMSGGSGLSDGSGEETLCNSSFGHTNGTKVDGVHSGGGCSSDNSDEWVDISDAEGQQQFIVVRERCNKVHRSPDWSRRVRDKRLHQKKAFSCIEDDSDHYYETLSPMSNKRHSTQLVQRSNSHHKRNQDLPRLPLRSSQRSRSYNAHGLGISPVSDDYDSFDTDTDEIYDAEENMKNQHNDSGVDIRNVKLPDPPTPTNQVYAIVRKLKNFISNKKSPNTSSKYGGSQQKLYENATQFYVSDNIYENSPKIKAKPNKYIAAKKSAAATLNDDAYENTEFHSPPKMNVDDKQLSTSEKNLCNTPAEAKMDTLNAAESATLRAKSKSGKSFKSRLRKSLAGASFDTKQLSVLTPTRSTFYIEDPAYGGSGELDSGFSEKASSGDLPTAPAVPTPDTQKFSTVARKTKKEAKMASAQRRRTTIGIRPVEPPPPPPPANSTTSWYAECGVFKQGTSGELQEEGSTLNDSKSSQHGSSMTNITSWYTESGLYQTSGVSVASSSGSSGVSTGNEGALSDDLPHSFFQNEPLYQIYSAAKLESITRDMEDHDSSTDGYEEVGQNGTALTHSPYVQKRRPRPSAYQLIEPKNGPARTLWSEIPEVINSCILPTLTPRERSLQEAKFEIITSEASYLKSMNLLRSHFMHHPIFRDTNVVSPRDRKALFAYIVPVHECSERLLTELEGCWQDNIMLLGLSRRIYTIAEKHFHVYIAFCEHQGRMDRTLRRLKQSKGIFSQNLDLLETSPTCCGLNLHSFLMLPMQRITRLPLLIDAVFSKVNPNDDEYESWKMTLAIMNKIVTQCNEAANRCEQAYEIERIARQLEFPSTIRALAVAPMGVPVPGSKPRFLVRKGELTHLIWRGDDVKLTFGKKFTKSTIYAFLFSDLLVLTKRKAEEHFTVFDYCPRSMLTISSGDLRDISQTHKNLILMTLLENHERKTVELVLSCPSVSEQERWLQAVRPPEPETPGEKLYEHWDCPQVITKHAYEAKEPDALTLEVGDVVNVTRKLPDGWYQGERIRDGAVGWFPGNFTEEVNSAHVRARNLKQRQRLLTFTATYLESQKRKY